MALSDSSVFMVGSGGHALSVLSSLEYDGIEVNGVIDPYPTKSTLTEFVIHKDFEDIPHEASLIVAIGDNSKRESMFRQIRSLKRHYELFTHISSKAVISRSARILDGAIIMPGSFVGPKATVGTGALINTNSVLEHETLLSDFASLAPASLVLGKSIVGHGSHVGPASIVDSKVIIGEHTILGGNSFLRNDLPDLVLAFGNPAIPTRRRSKGELYLV